VVFEDERLGQLTASSLRARAGWRIHLSGLGVVPRWGWVCIERSLAIGVGCSGIPRPAGDLPLLSGGSARRLALMLAIDGAPVCCCLHPRGMRGALAAHDAQRGLPRCRLARHPRGNPRQGPERQWATSSKTLGPMFEYRQLDGNPEGRRDQTPPCGEAGEKHELYQLHLVMFFAIGHHFHSMPDVRIWGRRALLNGG